MTMESEASLYKEMRGESATAVTGSQQTLGVWSYVFSNQLEASRVCC